MYFMIVEKQLNLMDARFRWKRAAFYHFVLLLVFLSSSRRNTSDTETSPQIRTTLYTRHFDCLLSMFASKREPGAQRGARGISERLLFSILAA